MSQQATSKRIRKTTTVALNTQTHRLLKKRAKDEKRDIGVVLNRFVQAGLRTPLPSDSN